MKKGFSLFELIIVVVVISIISIFVIQRSNNTIEFTNKTKIKSEIALVRNAISKQKTSNTLLNDETNVILDTESLEQDGSSLFKNVLDFPLISTSTTSKELAKWIKVSQNEYKIFISNDVLLEFVFENNSFICKSDISLCKEYE